MINSIICSIGWLLFVPVCCSAQADWQICIATDHGLITVSKTTDGKDRISFPISQWDAMQQGTGYCSANIPTRKSIHFCLEITSRKFKCQKGIGFSCSLFACKNRPCTGGKSVNRYNRVCCVLLEKPNSHSVQLVFLDEVDWESMQQ